jgi:7-keto-8-aminopelargonate synthetase-like enzyme
MKWLFFLFIAAAVAIILRVLVLFRKARRQRTQDWDEKLVSQLRARGQDPFQPHAVDFFFALPDEQSCAAVNEQLETDGFRVDVKAVPENKEFPFSLHATKSMRVHAMEMRERSRRFNEMALAHRGRYDGWSSE